MIYINNDLQTKCGYVALIGAPNAGKSTLLNRLESFATAPKDPKSELQEWAQGRGHSLPIYSEISRIGDAHNPIFEIKVTVDKHFATAKASSKKQAQKLAAEELLSKIG